MKIAVFEFDYHVMVLVSFCKLFKDSKHSVTVFTTTKIHDQIKEYNNDLSVNYVLKGEESLARFMDVNITLINSHDLIFFNTIASGYRTIFNTPFTVPSIIRIHNANTYLKPFQNLNIPKNFFELFKYVSYVVREMTTTLDFYYINNLRNKIDYICLNDYYREEFVIEKQMIERDKIFPCLPFAISDSLSKESNPLSTHLTITIPGSIDERRRDYSVVISAIKKAILTLEKPIVLYLLGKPIGEYANKIISLLKEISSDKIKVVTFNEFILQETFDKIIGDSDLILSPLIIENQFRIYKEIYGESKSSGGVFDMITYGKLTIFPASFFNDDEINKYIDYYDSSDSLALIITKYANDRDALIKRSLEFRRFLKLNYSSKTLLSKFEEDVNSKFTIN